MKKLESLRKELVGEEVDILELDNVMMSNNFLSESSSGVFKYCLEDGNIVYSEVTDDLGNTEPTIQIFFEIIIPASKGEVIEASILKITSVEKF